MLQCHAIFFYVSGKQDQLKTIDTNLWATCMLSESKPIPPLCPVAFKNAALRILHNTLHLSMDDITHTNCSSIYQEIVHNIELLVLDGTFRL